CLSCGKQAVQFHRALPGDLEARAIVLRRAKEDAAFVARLHEFFATVATAIPKLNFVIGDARMYSKAELAQRHRLPAVLINDLERATATALITRLQADGIKARAVSVRQLRRTRRIMRGMRIGGGIGVAVSVVALCVGGAVGTAIGGVALLPAIGIGLVGWVR